MTHRPAGAVRGTIAVLVCATLAFGSSRALADPGPTDSGGCPPGSPGLCDPYVPRQGNLGYQVVHYGIRVRYDDGRDLLRGRTRITAMATTHLRSFQLDLLLRARAVTVDGAPARFRQGRHELFVRPHDPIRRGERFVVVVRYAGRPGRFTTESGDVWRDTADGAWVSGYLRHAPLWYPANNHPSDKATFDIRVDARRGQVVVSNGRLVSRRQAGPGWVRTHWRLPAATAPNVTFVAIGDYTVVRGRSRDDVPYLLAVSDRIAPATRRNAWRHLRLTPRMVDFFSGRFGRYPFRTSGGIVVAAPRDYYWATEMQTRPLYSSRYFARGRDQEGLIAHEAAHQWFGDAVTVRRLRHIWLSEGFAVWSDWRWTAYRGGPSARQTFERTYRQAAEIPSLWRVPVTRPRPLISWASYTRAALTLQALRQRLGWQTFGRMVRGWIRTHRGGTVVTADFVRHAQRYAEADLDGFFQHWLRDPRPPDRTAENGFVRR